MLKDEFLKMQIQDLITSSNKGAMQMLKAFKEVLKDYPNETEIDPKLNCTECFNKLYNEAKKRASGSNSYFFDEEETTKFILNYLNLKPLNIKKESIKNLEDFF